MPRPALGLDFGTTNSALAVREGEGAPRLARFEGPDGATPTFRSLLYFDREDTRSPVEVHAGPAALVAYLEREVHGGRLIQSMKIINATAGPTGPAGYGASLPRELMEAARRRPPDAGTGLGRHTLPRARRRVSA